MFELELDLDVRQEVRRQGFAIRLGLMAVCGRRVATAYTVGLSERGAVDLLVTGRSHPVMGRILWTLTKAQQAGGSRWRAGMDITPWLGMRAQLLDEPAALEACPDLVEYSDAPRLLVVALADSFAHMPWTMASEEDPRFQPYAMLARPQGFSCH